MQLARQAFGIQRTGSLVLLTKNRYRLCLPGGLGA
jgi:hypothetical protein